jgi:hypothetical protein
MNYQQNGINNTSNNRNQEMLRVLLDVNRSLNTIERTVVNTDKKVAQVHTILLSKLTNVSTNHVVVPDVRRSERLQQQQQQQKQKKKSPSKKKSPEPRFSFF